MGAISPKDLWWGVKNQALEIIYSLFSWKEGSFVFGDTADELVNERIVLSINTSTVIMEGIRRLDESARDPRKDHQPGHGVHEGAGRGARLRIRST